MNWAIVGLAVANILGAVALIHLQNQLNRQRRATALLSQAITTALASVIAYINELEKEKN